VPICQESELEDSKLNVTILFAKAGYFDAQLNCQRLGGQIPLPANEKDFNDTIGNEYFSNSSNKLQCKKLWLPIVQVCFLLIIYY
jgi:hypothetical protein